MQSKSLLKNFFGYLRQPAYFIETTKKTTFQKALEIGRLFTFIYFIVVLLGLLTSAIISRTGYDLQQNSVVDLLSNAPIWTTVLLGCIIAPITEEFTFRLGLRFSYKKLALSLTFILIVFLQLLKDFVFTTWPQWFLSVRSIVGGLSYIVFIIVFAVLIYFLVRRFINYQRAESFYKRHIGLLFYFSIICFGLIHISNYLNLGSLILISPLFILPQIVAGILLGYIRMNYGFKWNILTHASYNFLTISPFVILSFGSEKMQKILINKSNASGALFDSLTQLDLILLIIVGFGILAVFFVFLTSNIQLLFELYVNRNKSS